MNLFKTSIRVEDNTPFGAVVSSRDSDIMVSLDGTFIEGSIVLKLSQKSWLAMQEVVNAAILKDMKTKLAGVTE